MHHHHPIGHKVFLWSYCCPAWLPQRYYSFHSWHQSMVRAAQRRLKDARQADAASGGGQAASECEALDADSEDEGEESEEMKDLRERLEKAAADEQSVGQPRGAAATLPE